MFTDKLRHVPMGLSATVLMAGLGCWLLAAPLARALDDTSQVLTGGHLMAAGQIVLTSPGFTQAQAESDFSNQGEAFVQMLMPAGTLTRLRVKVTTETAPSSGSFKLMVRINGADTNMTCNVTGPGMCTTGTKVKTIPNNARLAIKTTSDFVDAGTIGYTYTIQFD
jgi:hypothetical protein